MTTPYADLTFAREWGIPVAQPDFTVIDRLLTASAIIDDYTGLSAYGLSGGFAAQTTQTYTFNDVRLPLVSLPKPVSAITAVTVDNRVLASTAYTFDPTAGGLRLYTSGYLDVDGFPQASTAIGYGRRGFGAPYGSQVVVTGTFGYAAVPQPVRHATVLVTAFLCSGGGETFLDPRIAAVAVEGYLIRYPNRGGEGTELLETTGVIEADRLLRPYKLSAIQVA